MRIRHVIFFAAAAVMLVAGCSKQDASAPGFSTDPDAVRVEASVSAVTRTNPLGGEDSDKFNAGDQISVSNGTKTVKYQFDGNSWAPVADETGATDYLVWDTPVTFRAWYPVGRSTDGSEFTLPSVQDGNMGYYTLADADFMTSDACTYSTLKDIPGDRTFKPVLKRRMALVTIIIDKVADEFDFVKDIKVEVKNIYSAHSSVKLQSDGTFKSEGAAVNVSPYSHSIEGKSAYSAVVVPGDAADAKTFLQVSVDGYKDDEKTDPYWQLVEVTGIRAAEAGKHYTYKLIVGKETVKIGGVTVEDWTSGGPIDGKFEAEVDDYSEWDGTRVSGTYYFAGDGTSESPYLIKSATDLAGLAANVNSGIKYFDKYFRLETNIDLKGHEWIPIGKRGEYFYGTFDGNGKVITNLTISNATDCAGLFGIADGTIRNIILRNASVASSSVVALLVGESVDGVIKSCKVDGTARSGYCAAGIVGQSNSKVEISDCEVNVECYSDNDAGGVFGSKTNDGGAVVVKNCIVRGRILGKCVGGIAGMLQGSDVISGCKSYATLSHVDKTNDSVAGGLAGSAFYNCKFEDCEVYGDIDIESEYEFGSPRVGGAIGQALGATISNLKFEGTMTVKSIMEGNTVGAIVGVVDKSLTISSQCTYRKSGTGEFPPVGSYPEGVDISNIKGI